MELEYWLWNFLPEKKFKKHFNALQSNGFLTEDDSPNSFDAEIKIFGSRIYENDDFARLDELKIWSNSTNRFEVIEPFTPGLEDLYEDIRFEFEENAW